MAPCGKAEAKKETTKEENATEKKTEGKPMNDAEEEKVEKKPKKEEKKVKKEGKKQAKKDTKTQKPKKDTKKSSKKETNKESKKTVKRVVKKSFNDLPAWDQICIEAITAFTTEDKPFVSESKIKDYADDYMEGGIKSTYNSHVNQTLIRLFANGFLQRKKYSYALTSKGENFKPNHARKPKVNETKKEE